MLAGLVIGLCRNGDAAGDGNRFKADGDVHIVSEQIVFVGHHISHVDAQTKLHDSICGEMVVPFCHQRLYRDCRLDGPYDARKLHQETVAGVLHNATAVIENDRVYCASMGLERGMRTCLVGAHHSRIAGDVSANYGGEASLHLLRPVFLNSE
jgi:hypothetical protein